MKIVVEDSGPCRKVLKIAVPVEGVRETYESLRDDYVRAARVDGFRPGRAPAAIVERKYAAELKAETQERLISRAYRAALQESKLDPIHILDVQPDPFEKPNAPWNLAVTVEVAPEFDLPAYKGVALKRNPVEVTDADVDRALEEVRMERARYEDVLEGPAENDDLMAVDFEATMDGRPLEEVAPEAKGLGRGENFWTHLGRFATLPGFVEPFIGARIGEDRVVEVEFPNDFSVSAVRGRSARYAAKVRALRRRRPAELNEEFLKQWGVPTVEDLRRQLRENIAHMRQTDETRRLRNELLDGLLRAVTMDLPAEELREATQRNIQGLVGSLSRRGMTEEQIKEQKDKVLETSRQRSEGDLRVRFLLEKIARTEKIEVGENEVDAEIEALAQLRGEDPAAFRKRLEENQGVSHFRQIILQRKTMDFLMENAKVES